MEQTGLALAGMDEPVRSISPYLEMGAYEALWAEKGATFKRLAERFAANPDALPSDLVPRERALAMAEEVVQRFEKAGVSSWGVRVHRAGEYPRKLRDARYPVKLLYYAGRWELVETPSIAVVGTRKPSEEAIARTRKVVKALVEDGWTITSGLAAGIDTVAHHTAIDVAGRTIAVIGTPLSETYPRQNAELQRFIAEKYLVVSQVPVHRYYRQHPPQNRLFFPERNVTMSALTAATIIVEAGDTSGTLTQAKAALQQGRKLFILDSCFQNPELKWPHSFAQRGAVRIRDYEELRTHLAPLQD